MTIRFFLTFLAEEEGFEPSLLLQTMSFPSPPLQPLGYSSGLMAAICIIPKKIKTVIFI